MVDGNDLSLDGAMSLRIDGIMNDASCDAEK
jgi:hypothetical protein